MKAKLALLTGAAAGYVFGTKAGRQRYEELKAMVKQAMDNPKVHNAASDVQHKAGEAATRVAQAATAKVGGGRHADRDEPHDPSMPLD